MYPSEIHRYLLFNLQYSLQNVSYQLPFLQQLFCVFIVSHGGQINKQINKE